MTLRLFLLLLVGCLLWLRCPAVAADALPTGVAELHTTDGRSVAVQVEVAATGPARARGLMHRKTLPQDAGMWFDFGQTAPIAMWMKDTEIALDMLFVAADCTVVRVAENRRPGSLAHVRSGGPIRYVLEVNAGFAAREGIKEGSCVRLRSAPGVERGERLGKALQ